ncbi:triple tyrosine motif-containing protein [Winogradskyella forsetii]|uniref:triple tyrosine motif-containing protein n=1 Tax=Winogradskyella forsetii TaxID=2686077 RepID=UPI001E59239C|nr:triple tyrosine motif-containing protein [Winogradskyella forsetii]
MTASYNNNYIFMFAFYKGKISFCFLFIALIFSVKFNAQEIPPIRIFTPQDYGAEDQNWSITQADNNFIYIANNKGLLEYNGASWELYHSPNEGILRSVKVVGDRIYTGGYMDFGYWTKNKYNELIYKSLTKNQNFSIIEDEDFWDITEIEGYVLFQSLERIYIYNIANEKFEIIDSELRINKANELNKSIYFQKLGEGVMEIINGSGNLIIQSELIKDIELVNIYEFEKSLLLQTIGNGFYKFENNILTKWDIEADELLSRVSVYSSTRLKDGSFILGTISNGLIQLDSKGKVILEIDQSNGLSNNTVLSIKEDNDGNVWLGLDNGINVMNLTSPYRVYNDEQGVLGTVYSAAKGDDNLYLGTNHGLFYKAINSKQKYKFIENTQGQVWYLKYIKGSLFCGHDRGTFVINDTIAKQISTELGTWNINEIKGNANLLLQGNYKGLNILEKEDNQWRVRNKIEGFDISSRYLEFFDSNKILVSHEHKGVYKIELDSTFYKVNSVEKLNIEKGIKSSIVKYNGTVFYGFKNGVFRFDSSSESFKKDSVLSALFSEDKYISGKLINDEVQNKLWGFTKNEIIYVEPGKLTNDLQGNVIEIPHNIRKTKSGFENVLHIEKDTYLIGDTEGYLVLHINKLKKDAKKLYLNSASYTSLQNEFVSFDTSQPIELENKNNIIRFRYSTPSFDELSRSKYQYRLLGIYDYWSEWSDNGEILFENLPHGDYTFEARAITGGILSNNVLSYEFTIEKPWYLKPLAIISYFFVALLFIYVLYYFNRKHYKKEQQKLIKKKERQLKLEQLENQRQLIQFKNKNLRQDIENKNRELGMATMNLVKRNELLGNIKSELSKSKSLNEVGKVVKLINSSINDTNDWELFEEAFNNVDKDFMKKIKTLHPSITPNDLRLCAYLRLNLSSKEIAPLLNISHKSVEVKRYRLRKKMELDHEQSLSNYIIEL